jgi:hypothetical protein
MWEWPLADCRLNPIAAAILTDADAMSGTPAASMTVCRFVLNTCQNNEARCLHFSSDKERFDC